MPYLTEDGSPERPEKKIQCATELWPHQIQGVERMIELERSEQNGGILADESELGKTVQVLNLIYRAPAEDQKHRATLIVTPARRLQHWKQEFEQHYPWEVFLKHSMCEYNSMSIPGSFEELATYMIVTVSWEALKRQGEQHHQLKKTTSYRPGLLPFYAGTWYRIILDRPSKFVEPPIPPKSSMVGDLRAKFRWCVEGIPPGLVSHTIFEMHGQLKFIDSARYKRYQELVRGYATNKELDWKIVWPQNQSSRVRVVNFLKEVMVWRSTKDMANTIDKEAPSAQGGFGVLEKFEEFEELDDSTSNYESCVEEQ